MQRYYLGCYPAYCCPEIMRFYSPSELKAFVKKSAEALILVVYSSKYVMRLVMLHICRISWRRLWGVKFRPDATPPTSGFGSHHVAGESHLFAIVNTRLLTMRRLLANVSRRPIFPHVCPGAVIFQTSKRVPALLRRGVMAQRLGCTTRERQAASSISGQCVAA